MPATFVVSAENLKTVLKELRELDPNLRKELQKEMRTELAPFGKKLLGGIPKTAPLSGMSRQRGASSPWLWSSVGNRVVTPLSKRAKKPGYYPVVSLRYRSRGKTAGFEIAELARNGRSNRGNAFVRNLNARAPISGGLGRFVIPQFKQSGPEITAVAVRIIEKFANKVSRRLR